MLKENVFVVSGRHCKGGCPRGEVVNYVVCSLNDQTVKTFMKEQMPNYVIFAVTGLVMMEERVKQIKAALAGKDHSLSVFVDPEISKVSA